MVRVRKTIGYVGLVVGLVSLLLGILFLQGWLFEGGLLFSLLSYTLLAVDRMEERLSEVLEEARAARRAAGRAAYLAQHPSPQDAPPQGDAPPSER